MTDEVLWAMVGAIATAVSAGAAAGQIFYSRRESTRRATLEQLREVDVRLQPLWKADPVQAGEAVLAWYRHEGDLSDDAANYLSFLNSLDLLAFAYGRDVLDRKMTDDYIDTLLRSHVVSLSFLTELQRCCGDSRVYEHLRALLLKHEDVRRLQSRRPRE
jgi:hypothetical protein